MEPVRLLEALAVAEKLKDATRHCYTSGGRRESVAEHSWRITLMAYFVSDEFPEADIEKLMKMCLIHDLGEAFTGDIPTFEKTESDEEKEAQRLKEWVRQLPEAICRGKCRHSTRRWRNVRHWKPEFIRHWTIWRH